MKRQVIILEAAKIFLDSLEPKLMAKSYRTIQMLGEFGTLLTLPHSRKIAGTDDLFELRVQVATNICRLFYFHFRTNIFVIVSGFIKKQNRTDPSEIKKALRIRKLYIEHKSEEKNEGK